jgi:hypothetical protein
MDIAGMDMGTNQNILTGRIKTKNLSSRYQNYFLRND